MGPMRERTERFTFMYSSHEEVRRGFSPAAGASESEAAAAAGGAQVLRPRRVAAGNWSWSCARTQQPECSGLRPAQRTARTRSSRTHLTDASVVGREEESEARDAATAAAAAAAGAAQVDRSRAREAERGARRRRLVHVHVEPRLVQRAPLARAARQQVRAEQRLQSAAESARVRIGGHLVAIAPALVHERVVRVGGHSGRALQPTVLTELHQRGGRRWARALS